MKKDFTWTSSDIIGQNCFLFTLNELTKRALKFASEPMPPSYAAATTADSSSGSSGSGGSDSDAASLQQQQHPHPDDSLLSFDPVATYHFHRLSQAPRLVWHILCKFARERRASLAGVCKWDGRLLLEAFKLGLAIILASANELTPRDWTPIYPRLSHGWWAPMTVAFTMSDSVGAHMNSMLMRAAGTIIGGVAGYLAAVICEGNRVALVAALTCFNVLCTFGRSDQNYGYAHLVAGLTAIVIAAGRDQSFGGNVSDFAFVRIEQTLSDITLSTAATAAAAAAAAVQLTWALRPPD